MAEDLAQKLRNARKNTRDSIEKILLSKRIITADGHWLWSGSTNDGHGTVQYEGKMEYVHRLAAMLWLEYDLESDKLICHKCRYKDCYNPICLYVGNRSSNQRDAVRDGTHSNTRKTECPQGHEYSQENTYERDGKRYCKTCKRQRWNAWNSRRKSVGRNDTPN